MKGSEFVFDYVHLLYYKCHNWIKINKEINSISKKDKCKSQKDPQRMTKIKPFINKYNTGKG